MCSLTPIRVLAIDIPSDFLFITGIITVMSPALTA